jgi:hypothetical protein
MTTDNFCFYLLNRLIPTSQTGGQWYSDTSPFSIPWFQSLFPCPMILILSPTLFRIIIADRECSGRHKYFKMALYSPTLELKARIHWQSLMAYGVLCWVSFMLHVIYAECHKWAINAECRYPECRGAKIPPHNRLGQLGIDRLLIGPAHWSCSGWVVISLAAT